MSSRSERGRGHRAFFEGENQRKESRTNQRLVLVTAGELKVKVLNLFQDMTRKSVRHDGALIVIDQTDRLHGIRTAVTDEWDLCRWSVYWLLIFVGFFTANLFMYTLCS